MKGPVVAIAGADEFVGAHVARRLVTEGVRVRASYRPGEPLWHVADIDCEWRALRLERPPMVRTFLEGCAALICCVDLIPCNAEDTSSAKRLAVKRLRALFDACRTTAVERVVFVSSAATMAHGDGDGESVSEGDYHLPAGTEMPRIEAATAVEAEVYRYVARGLAVTIVAPTWMMGPGDISLRSVGFVQAVAAGRFPAIPTGQLINVVDVRDVARGVGAALRSGRAGRRYAFGGQNLGLSQLGAKIAELAEARPPSSISPSLWTPVARHARSAARVIGVTRNIKWMDSLQVARQLGAVNNRRAREELNLRERKIDKILGDTVCWLTRVGALGWRCGRLRTITTELV